VATRVHLEPLFPTRRLASPLIANSLTHLILISLLSIVPDSYFTRKQSLIGFIAPYYFTIRRINVDTTALYFFASKCFRRNVTIPNNVRFKLYYTLQYINKYEYDNNFNLYMHAYMYNIYIYLNFIYILTTYYYVETNLINRMKVLHVINNYN
jgi:hypothetical protein